VHEPLAEVHPCIYHTGEEVTDHSVDLVIEHYHALRIQAVQHAVVDHMLTAQDGDKLPVIPTDLLYALIFLDGTAQHRDDGHAEELRAIYLIGMAVLVFYVSEYVRLHGNFNIKHLMVVYSLPPGKSNIY